MNKMEQQYLISPDSKASEVILSSPKMVRLIQSLGIPLGFGDISIGQLCRNSGISEALFTALSNMLLHPDYKPDIAGFTVDDANLLVKYLETSHSYYRNVSFPQVHANVHKIAALCAPETSMIVNRFFDEYDAEMTRHISNEENGAFAFIQKVLAGNPVDFTNDESSLGHHDDVQIKIEDFKSIIAKYIPQECNCPERYNAVIQMMHISDDLHFHTRVEDGLLFPLVSKIRSELA